MREPHRCRLRNNLLRKAEQIVVRLGETLNNRMPPRRIQVGKQLKATATPVKHVTNLPTHMTLRMTNGAKVVHNLAGGIGLQGRPLSPSPPRLRRVTSALAPVTNMVRCKATVSMSGSMAARNRQFELANGMRLAPR